MRILSLACILGLAGFIPSCVKAPSTTIKERIMTSRASGQFDVKVTPLPADDKSDATAFGRLAIDKRFHGDLEGVSKGEMLAFGTGTSGSGAYVALERVSGALVGRKGTFVLQHNGTMSGGNAQMTVTVVPESGTEELAGLTGKMTIRIADGKHWFDFDYTLVDGDHSP